jgi:hypothetical protein
MSKNETTLDLDSIPVETGDENSAQKLIDSVKEQYEETFKGRKTSLFEEPDDKDYSALTKTSEDDDFEIVIEGQEPDVVEEPVDEPVKQPVTPPRNEDAQKDNQRKSRAKDRIQELASDKKRLEEEKKELQRQLQEKDNQALGAKQETLKAHLDSIKKELRIAKENADIDKEIELTEKLQETVFSLAVIEANKQRPQPEPKEEPVVTKAQEAKEDTTGYEDYYDEGEERNVPAEEWFTKNAFWLSRDPEKKALALVIDKELAAEGKISFTDKSYFDELDRRLDAKLNPKPQPKQNPPPVGGASRNAAPGITTKPQIKLSEADVATIRKYNLDPKTYAKNKQAQLTDNRTSYLQ